MKKQWYLIETECIKFNPSLTCKVGEKTIVAKIKTIGLAHLVAQNLTSCYKPEYFIIRIK